MTLYLSACFNTVATYIAILLCVTQDDCAKLVFGSWAQTAEYGFGAPEIYFITIFGAPKVHYIIILNSLDCPDLLQELPFTTLWPPLGYFCAPALKTATLCSLELGQPRWKFCIVQRRSRLHSVHVPYVLYSKFFKPQVPSLQTFQSGSLANVIIKYNFK